MKRNLMNWSLAILLALTAAGVGMTGCSTLTGSQSSADATDQKLSSAVKSKLKRDPVYKFNGVQVSAAAGTVQLSGFTQNDKAQQRAAEIAKNVEGVKDVINNIVVQQ
jgi:osmotically-inducible protein OsmY